MAGGCVCCLLPFAAESVGKSSSVLRTGFGWDGTVTGTTAPFKAGKSFTGSGTRSLTAGADSVFADSFDASTAR